MGKDTTIPETDVCPLVDVHKEHKVDGLWEEQDPRHLINGCLVDSKYSVCKTNCWVKKISDKDDSWKENILSDEFTVYACEYFKTQ